MPTTWPVFSCSSLRESWASGGADDLVGARAEDLPEALDVQRGDVRSRPSRWRRRVLGWVAVMAASSRWLVVAAVAGRVER